MTRTESLVIALWNKGLNVEQIADELCLDEDIIEAIIEDPTNYGFNTLNAGSELKHSASFFNFCGEENSRTPPPNKIGE